jgi:hypothetical protein
VLLSVVFVQAGPTLRQQLIGDFGQVNLAPLLFGGFKVHAQHNQ